MPALSEELLGSPRASMPGTTLEFIVPVAFLNPPLRRCPERLRRFSRKNRKSPYRDTVSAAPTHPGRKLLAALRPHLSGRASPAVYPTGGLEAASLLIPAGAGSAGRAAKTAGAPISPKSPFLLNCFAKLEQGGRNRVPPKSGPGGGVAQLTRPNTRASTQFPEIIH